MPTASVTRLRRIRRARVPLLSLARLGGFIGVSECLLSQIETGTKAASRAVQAALAAYFSVPQEALFDDAGVAL
ncbi:MAG: helix-turn-helix domain-containing protein [Synergistaceae bacterium]|jgi:transcriptional regulator with XRE-family HTH domain|nr:helix-turn-helix domain-containing protein [Synergistaceae bacterium]